MKHVFGQIFMAVSIVLFMVTVAHAAPNAGEAGVCRIDTKTCGNKKSHRHASVNHQKKHRHKSKRSVHPLQHSIQVAAIECPVGSGDYCSGKTPKCCYGNGFYCAASCT